ncbi:MAG: MFS transporter, partial [Bryobacterales bacterium]|nr:MFS transporter [Bryobacteraceae bacterium]MDW8129546.1 MFS transporter [Bryobacterales bacterium]
LAGLVAAYAAQAAGWRNAFFIPGLIAIACAFYLLWRMRDTPQSEGLPPIEQYRQDEPDPIQRTGERELGTRELLVDYILRNRYLWLFASANFFVYIARYAMLDWGPTYLKEVKQASVTQGGHSTAILEFAGIFSTLLMGWLSDRLRGRRGMVSLLCMIPVAAAFAGILWAPPGMLWLDLLLFGVIGFFVYPPVMLLGVAGLDFTSKKAVGAGAGFIGLFGYLGRTAQGKGLGWLVDRWGWDAALWTVFGCALVAIALLGFTWNLRPLTARQP